MASTTKPAVPPSAEARDNVLMVIRSTAEPLAGSAIAKLLVAPHKISAAALEPILDEFVAAGQLHKFAAKTAKGKPRYWDRDAHAMGRAAVLAAVQVADVPLTARELAGRLTTPLKFTEVELTPILAECLQEKLVHAIPPATAKGKPRYWNRDVLEFGWRAIQQTLETKGPQPEASLKKVAKGFSDAQFQQIIHTAIAGGMAWRHPPFGKVKTELIGRRPLSPEPYLQEVGSQLKKVVEHLLAASVPRDELRRAVVQLAEAAGVSFAGTASSNVGAGSVAQASAIDLPGLMRRLEPGADRGALVGSRDLRRAANVEKSQFDQAVLQLARQGKLSLHRHDYPASLTQAERDELVTDGEGTYYVGMALRQN